MINFVIKTSHIYLLDTKMSHIIYLLFNIKIENTFIYY